MNRSILFLVVVMLLAGCTNISPPKPSTANATQPISPCPTCAIQPTCPLYPTPARLVYLWPQNLPEGYLIHRPSARVDEDGFQLIVNVPTPGERKGGFGYDIYLAGGTYAKRQGRDIEQEKYEIVYIRGNQGQLVQRDNLNCYVYWQENGNTYFVDGTGVERDIVLAVAETAARIDLFTWVQQIIQLP